MSDGESLHVLVPDAKVIRDSGSSRGFKNRTTMARHFASPHLGRRCGDNGDATADPVGASLIGESRRRGLDRPRPHCAAWQESAECSARHLEMLGSLTDEGRGHGWRYVEGPRE